MTLASRFCAGYLSDMLRLINAIFLSLTLAFTSYSMAVARGQSPDIGTDMVICTGVGMTTITIGPDGEPIEATHICPDAMSIFATGVATVGMPVGESLLQLRVACYKDGHALSQETLTPSARGPPLGV